MPAQPTLRNLRDLPLALQRLRPPYDHFHDLPIGQLAETRNVPGSIVVISLADVRRAAEPLREWVPAIRRAAYWAPLVVKFDGAQGNERVYISSLAGRLGISAVLLDGDPIPETLRLQLAEAAGFQDIFVEWITLARPHADPQARDLVAKLLHLREVHDRDEPSVLQSAGTTSSTARRWLHRASLPGPSAFLRFGRLSPILLDLQRDPRRGIETVLHDHEPLEASSLTHLVERLIGVRPTEIRRTIGWQWWATRFLDRPRRRT